MGKNPIYICVDESGELANSTDFCKTVVGLHLILEITGGYASNLNGKNESMNGNAKSMVRTFFQARSHSDDKWYFAFCYAIWIIRCVLNTQVKMTPYEKWHDIKPSFKDLTVCGCHVYVLNATVTRKALDSRTQTDLRDVVANSNINGYFMGYNNTTKFHPIKSTIQVLFSLLNVRLVIKNLCLRMKPLFNFKFPTSILQHQHFLPQNAAHFQVPLPPQGHRFYLQVGDDTDYHIPFLDKVHPESPWLTVLSPNARHNMWIVSINEEESIMALSFIEYIQTLQHPTDTVTATLILAKCTSTGAPSKVMNGIIGNQHVFLNTTRIQKLLFSANLFTSVNFLQILKYTDL
eukprot:scaffold4052_cov64-Attheya_sp.AAC.7